MAITGNMNSPSVDRNAVAMRRVAVCESPPRVQPPLFLPMLKLVAASAAREERHVNRSVNREGMVGVAPARYRVISFTLSGGPVHQTIWCQPRMLAVVALLFIPTTLLAAGRESTHSDPGPLINGVSGRNS